MPFVPVPDVIRVAMVFRDTSGNEAVNILHFRDANGAPNIARMNLLANAIVTWAGAEWAPLAASSWQLDRIEMRDLSAVSSWYTVVDTSIQGTEQGQALPSQNTIAVSLRSPYVGRSRRGRLYFVGLSEVAVNGDYLIGTSRDVIIAAYYALKDATSGQDFVWSVVSYVENGVPRAVPLVTAVQTIIITDDVIDSMDKRKPGN